MTDWPDSPAVFRNDIAATQVRKRQAIASNVAETRAGNQPVIDWRPFGRTWQASQ